MASKIDPRKIRTDCGTQSRIEMNEAVIAEYAEAMERGEEFPAIEVFFDECDDSFILADGFHRHAAHMRVKPNDPILAEQRIGTVEDALWASLAANKSHGLHRSNADKRNAVKLAMVHPKGCELSDRQIGKHVGVDHKTVAVIRRDAELSGEIPQIQTRTVQRGGQTYQQNTTQVGKGKKSRPDRNCGTCANLQGDYCQIDHEGQAPWTPACDLFTPIPPEREEEEIVKPQNYRIVELKAKRSRHPQRKNKPRNTVCVDVPLDNAPLAAVELRTLLGEEYLAECFIAVRMLLRADNNSDDPFPGLDR